MNILKHSWNKTAQQEQEKWSYVKIDSEITKAKFENWY